MNILITGGNGYIAKSLYNKLKDKYNIITITRQNFNLTNYDAVCEWFHERYFDVVIHTAIVGGSRLKEEDQTVLNENLIMYNNLFANKHHFNKLISFGSGAETFQPDTPYGISKNEIADSIRNTKNFYNLRIFGVFDENELATRFIKSNLQRYIRRESMIIHTDKIMDFFYMKDLISLVDYYIHKDGIKEINCSYEYKYTLSNIANIINKLDTYTVPVVIENKSKLDFYCGEYSELPIKTVGMVAGIKNTFEILRYSINLI
jgi:GDP-L-fucose synthase